MVWVCVWVRQTAHSSVILEGQCAYPLTTTSITTPVEFAPQGYNRLIFQIPFFQSCQHNHHSLVLMAAGQADFFFFLRKRPSLSTVCLTLRNNNMQTPKHQSDYWWSVLLSVWLCVARLLGRMFHRRFYCDTVLDSSKNLSWTLLKRTILS